MFAKVHNITKVYEGKIFDVAVEKVTLPNGVVKDREVVRHPGAAAMVPILDDGKVVLIRQYRHAIGGFLLEIPAGTLDVEDVLVFTKDVLLDGLHGSVAATVQHKILVLPQQARCVHAQFEIGA